MKASSLGLNLNLPAFTFLFISVFFTYKGSEFEKRKMSIKKNVAKMRVIFKILINTFDN